MTLWSARNGFQGCGPVAALVEADTEDEARILAEAALRWTGDDQGYSIDEYSIVESIRRVDLPYVGDVLP